MSKRKKKQRVQSTTLIIVALAIIAVVLSILVAMSRSEPKAIEMPISDNVMMEDLGGEVIKAEDIIEEVTCEEGLNEFVLDKQVFALCLPEQIKVTGEQPIVGDSGIQVSMFFSDSSSLIYQTRDYKHSQDPSIVNFACLQNVSRLQWETCFAEGDDVVSMKEFETASGLNAIQTTVDLKQSEQDSLQRAEFIFVPGIQKSGKTYDVVVPVGQDANAQAMRLVNSVNLIGSNTASF